MWLTDIVSAMGLTFFPEVALVIFLVVFVAVVVRLYWKTRKSDFDAIAAIPLTDEVVTPRPHDQAGSSQMGAKP